MTMQTDARASRGGVVDEDLSLVRILNALLRNRRLLIAIPGVAVLAAAALGLTRPRHYTATAAFVPQRSSAAPSGIGGLAAQFGIAIPAGDAAESPAFYAELIRSRGILEPALETKYRVGAGSGSRQATLIELYDVRARGTAARREAALRRLRSAVSVTTSRTTDMVRVGVSTRWPEVSQQVAARVIALVNQFNLETRRSRAGAERRFVEERLREARAALDQADSRLASFLQRNAQYRAPQLALEHERLQRDVAMRQQVYTSLAESYEKARIDEVRNTPVITVIEEPAVPLRPNGRGVVRLVVLAFTVGMMLALALVLVREFFGRTRHARGAEYEELEQLRAATLYDLSRPWRLLRPGRRA